MKTNGMPFMVWTKKEISNFCIANGYGEPKFSGKNKTLYINDNKMNWVKRIVIEIASRRLRYQVKFQ